MSLIELIVCSAVFCVCVPTFFIGFSSSSKAIKKISDKSFRTEKILLIDRKIREEIWKIKIPYWKNREKIILEKMQFFYEMNFVEKVEMRNIFPLRNESGKIIGLKVFWKIENEEQETVELF